ncbi:MAG TPA: hypothetical protein VEZ14_13105 [Dehalococcoidia bacterium]|nr:hypothetical protein [Dehalococcoidia bacterium]
MTRPSAPARPAQPARPQGTHAQRRRRASAGVALLQGAAAPAGVLLARRSNAPEVWLPANAGPVAFLPGIGAAFSAWQSLGAPASDLYLTQLHALHVFSGGSAGLDIAEFSYGAGNTPIDVTRRTFAFADAGNDANGWYNFSQETRPGKIPAGQTAYARGRIGASTGPNAPSMECALVGFAGAYPTFDALDANTATGPGRIYPSNTTTQNLVSGAAPAWGASLTVIDPAPNDLLATYLMGGVLIGDFASQWLAVQVGIGPAGGETWLATVYHAHAHSSGWIWPPVWVKSGERLALRGMAAGVIGRSVALKVHDL